MRLEELVDRSEEMTELVASIVSKVLEYDGVRKAVLAEIPKDWEYPEMKWGDNPTTLMVAFAWLWEQIMKVEVEDDEEGGAGDSI